MEAAWRRNRPKLLERLDRVRSAVATPPDAASDAMHQLRADLHALIGALGTYGFDQGSRLLARLQSDVVSGQPFHGHLPELDALRQTLETAEQP
jgi:hypothetical protein